MKVVLYGKVIENVTLTIIDGTEQRKDSVRDSLTVNGMSDLQLRSR